MRICLVKRCRISRRTTALARLAGSMVKDNFPPRKIKSSARYIKERFRIFLFFWGGGDVCVLMTPLLALLLLHSVTAPI